MIDIRADDRLIISGLTGTGKTYLLRFFASQFVPNIEIVDPLDQYSMFPDECRYIPKRETPNELEEVCSRWWSRENGTLIIEEAEQYLQQGRAMLPRTSGLIRMGRNWGVGVWGSTRRIQDINKRFFDLCQHAFFFKCGLQSREYIAKMIGNEYMYKCASPKYNKTGYTILTLPPYAFLHLDLKSETAEVSTLMLGAREHIKAVGKGEGVAKAKIRVEDVKEEEVEETEDEVKEVKDESKKEAR